MLINLSICLSDIPKDRIKLANNGKKYLAISVQDLREADEYGNTHSVYATQTKEEREAKEKRTYIGRGKEVVFRAATPTIEDVESLPAAENLDDLPF
ncbi:MAG: hypothetical protein IIU94_03535 [Alistipes sp.]|nr:hypothetical protein [Alistipes sp.]MBQ5903150.1 hypothetical protein [Alistipes sp.]